MNIRSFFVAQWENGKMSCNTAKLWYNLKMAEKFDDLVEKYR
jgi:hypothetical protein